MVHASRLLPALNNVLPDIETYVETLTVANVGQTKAQAIMHLRSLAAFQDIKNAAREFWDVKYVNLIANDHNTNGPTETAEHAVVDPVGISICNLKNTNPSWSGCASCPY